MQQNEKKRQAALAALEYIPDGAALGVGTGSTVNFFIDALPEVRSKISTVVSSSEASTELLQSHGFEVSTLAETGDLDLYVDGADEITEHLHMIKGGGGALTREKIVAATAKKFICVADQSKLVSVLGEFPLPIEVIPMARSYVARELVRLGGHPILREEFTTDNGNIILDCNFGTIKNPKALTQKIKQTAGVLESGIFLRKPDIIYKAKTNGKFEII